MVLVVFVLLSIIVNLLFFYIEVLPFVKRRFISRKSNFSNNISEEKILKASMNLLMSDAVTMIWNDNVNLIDYIRGRLREKRNRKLYYFHFPRGYLFYGIIKYLIDDSVGNTEDLNSVKKRFDECINFEGKASFELVVIDQVVFGLSAIELYKCYNDPKYLIFLDQLYEFILRHTDERGIVKYRLKEDLYLVDTLGMVVEFLNSYGVLKNDKKIISFAKNQIDFYIKHGTDSVSLFPSHAIVCKDLIKVGPSNWGRGIGWFVLGLKSCLEIDNTLLEFSVLLKKKLNLHKISSYKWSQFLSTSKELDSSASLMVTYGLFLEEVNELGRVKFIELCYDFIDKNGIVDKTSGDTSWINCYSGAFGKSELSQGILMMILSEIKKK